MSELTNMEASSKLEQVEVLAAKLGAAEEQIEVGYGQLATGLKEVADGKLWSGFYDSFQAFLLHLKTKYKLGRAQLYNYLSTARELDGDVSADQLSQMGISKAMVLRDAKKGGDGLAQESIAAALDPKVSVKELKELLFKAGVLLPEDATNSYFDLEFAFMVNEDEKLTLNAAISAAMHTDPPTNGDAKPSAQKKDIAMKWAMSYLSEHAENAIEDEGAEDINNV